jgi:hypothetical protein
MTVSFLGIAVFNAWLLFSIASDLTLGCGVSGPLTSIRRWWRRLLLRGYLAFTGRHSLLVGRLSEAQRLRTARYLTSPRID